MRGSCVSLLCLAFGVSFQGISSASICRCADTGVCVLPAGECNSVGKPLVAPLARKIALRHKVIRQDA